MTVVCFNCQEEIKGNFPICPHCYVVLRQESSREELFDFLEGYFPTIPSGSKKFTSTKKPVMGLNYTKWFIIGILTFGIGYYVYLLHSLKSLNDHWYYPHGPFENETKVDMLTATLLLIFTNFLCIPILQYARFEKLRRHLIMAPSRVKDQYVPMKGKNIFWFYFLLNVLISGTTTMLILGFSSIIAGKYIEFNTVFAAVLFFLSAGLILVIGIILAVRLVQLEKEWQEEFNDHLSWHTLIIEFEKKKSSID